MEPLEEIHACQPPVFVVGQKVNLKGQLEDIHHAKSQNSGQTETRLCGNHYIHSTSIIYNPIVTMCFTDGYGMLVDKRPFPFLWANSFL